MKFLIMQFSRLPRYLVPLRPKYSPQHHILKHPQPTFLPQCQHISSNLACFYCLRGIQISYDALSLAQQIPNTANYLCIQMKSYVINKFCGYANNARSSIRIYYKVVQIWPGLFVCKSGDISPGHIWTTLYITVPSSPWMPLKMYSYQQTYPTNCMTQHRRS